MCGSVQHDSSKGTARTVIRHPTTAKWEGLTICEVLQNAFSKRRVSSPKVTQTAESSFSLNRPLKSALFSILGFYNSPKWILKLATEASSLLAFCFYLFPAFISDRAGQRPRPRCLFFSFFLFLSLSRSVSYLPQLPCPPSHQLCSVISHAVQMFHPHYSICSSSSLLPPPPLDLLVLHSLIPWFFFSPRWGLDWHVTLLCEELSNKEQSEPAPNNLQFLFSRVTSKVNHNSSQWLLLLHLFCYLQ